MNNYGCIYKIYNNMNNKVYIGQTTNYKRRVKDHNRMLQNNVHTNKFLQLDYNTYGSNCFSFQVIEDNVLKCNLLERERYWVDYYGGIENLTTYNMTTYKHINSYVKTQISKGNSGKTRTDLFKIKMSNVKNDLYRTNNDTKIKISSALKKYYKTQQGKQQINQMKLQGMKLNTGINNPMYGKHHTEYSKNLISEHKQGQIPWNKGKVGLYKATDETKNKQRLASTKYDKLFIDTLKQAYYTLGTYKAVADKYNMNTNCVSRLIRFGSTKIPQSCND